MSFKSCIAILNSDKAYDRLTPTEKENLLKELADEIKKQRLELKDGDLAAAVNKYILGAKQDAEIKAAITQRNSLLNLIVTEKQKMFQKNFIDKSKKFPRFEAISAWLQGSIKLRLAGNNSVDQLAQGSFHTRQSVMLKLLERENVLDEYVKGRIDLDIWKEMGELYPGGKPGISNNPTAEKIARILSQVLGEDIDKANRWGAWIIKRKGYIIKQTHDPWKLEKSGYEHWVKRMTALVDHEETLKGVAPDKTKEFWTGIFTGLKTGVHLKFDGPGDLISSGFVGPGNLAKRMSTAHRMIHFKNAEAAYTYNKEFGMGNLREVVNLTIMHMNRNIAMLQMLGTNPRGNLRAWINRAIQETKKELVTKPNDKNLTKELRKLEEAARTEMNDLWYAYKDISGETKIPGHLTGAMWVHSVGNVADMSKLGMATVTSVADTPQVMKELAHHGIEVHNAYGQTIEGLFKSRGAKGSERRMVVQMLGLGMDSILGNIISKFHTGDMVPGMWAKTHQHFFRLNTLSWWTDTFDSAIGFGLSHWLARNAEKSYKDMNGLLRARLFEHGIQELEWEHVFRNAVWTSPQGHKFLVTDFLSEISDDILLSYLRAKEPNAKTFSKAKIARTRDEMVGKLTTYFRHAADRGVPKPSAWERSAMQRGTVAGSPEGAFLRFMFKFKSFPLTVLHKSIGREIFGHGAETFREGLSKTSNLMGLSHLIIGASVMGYVSIVISDLLRGKTPRMFREDDAVYNTQLMMAAMAKGGGLGLYGDFLFGQFNRYGADPTHTLLGPIMGQFGDIWKLYSLAVHQGDVGKALTHMAKVIQANTPFANLYYLRLIFDYFLLYNIQELHSPGYLRRLEGRLKKEHKTGFYIRPSRVIPRGGTINIPKILKNMVEEATK